MEYTLHTVIDDPDEEEIEKAARRSPPQRITRLQAHRPATNGEVAQPQLFSTYLTGDTQCSF